jgi:hypothetical protein
MAIKDQLRSYEHQRIIKKDKLLLEGRLDMVKRSEPWRACPKKEDFAKSKAAEKGWRSRTTEDFMRIDGA